MANMMDKLVSLCKRRGFIFQSSEVYGGLNGCWDYGPLGVELLRNIKDTWWKSMTYREDVEGLDASILMHPRVWEASGHVDNFTDPLIDCKSCKARFRDDALSEAQRGARQCPVCGNKGVLTEPRAFNLMFKTFVGPVEEDNAKVYLRPETAQGIYVNFLNVQAAMRQKLPFGIAQIGKAFRNEINTKNFLFRTREFEQMEMQFFVKPGTEDHWFNYWRQERWHWFSQIGLPEKRLRWHEHDKLAHYARAAFDVEYEFPFGWGEIEGLHNRGDFDLDQHEKFSGKALRYFDEESREKILPWVIETSIGASRTTMACLVEAYREEEVEGETRVVMRFHPCIAPLKAAILPLVRRDGMDELARQITAQLRPHFPVFYDEGGAIGRRYRRMDEIGTPYCVTVDSQTLQDQTVTLRERDSMAQDRVAIPQLREEITRRIEHWAVPQD
ncbi:MAG: glycine--tRNA ligase [Candidatus Handelsmanbacteria bacterium]|nr:glycine--tRNA ligase [Candidatus Handelsmanbacteria bacterium]